MKVAEIMTSNPVCCTPSASLSEVARLMLEHDCEAIPVVESMENKNLLGMISDRDIAIRAVARNKNPLALIVAHVMTDDPVPICPESSVEECGEAMTRHHVRWLPVIDGDGVLCGLVTQADLVAREPGTKWRRSSAAPR